jgi:hypothetical protein
VNVLAVNVLPTTVQDIDWLAIGPPVATAVTPRWSSSPTCSSRRPAAG